MLNGLHAATSSHLNMQSSALSKSQNPRRFWAFQFEIIVLPIISRWFFVTLFVPSHVLWLGWRHHRTVGSEEAVLLRSIMVIKKAVSLFDCFKTRNEFAFTAIVFAFECIIRHRDSWIFNFFNHDTPKKGQTKRSSSCRNSGGKKPRKRKIKAPS